MYSLMWQWILRFPKKYKTFCFFGQPGIIFPTYGKNQWFSRLQSYSQKKRWRLRLDGKITPMVVEKHEFEFRVLSILEDFLGIFELSVVRRKEQNRCFPNWIVLMQEKKLGAWEKFEFNHRGFQKLIAIFGIFNLSRIQRRERNWWLLKTEWSSSKNIVDWELEKELNPVVSERSEFQHQGKSILIALFGINTMWESQNEVL